MRNKIWFCDQSLELSGSVIGLWNCLQGLKQVLNLVIHMYLQLNAILVFRAFLRVTLQCS